MLSFAGTTIARCRRCGPPAVSHANRVVSADLRQADRDCARMRADSAASASYSFAVGCLRVLLHQRPAQAGGLHGETTGFDERASGCRDRAGRYRD
jgi:hypothetical protein